MLKYTPSDHEKKIIELFGGETKFVKGLEEHVKKGIRDCDVAMFLCFSNRCGSTLFSDVISQSLKIQRAVQVLNGSDAERGYRRRGPFSNLYDLMGFYCRNINGKKVFFCKCTWFQLYFIDRFGIVDHFAENTHFILNFRKDILSQAISMSIAQQTKSWVSNQKPQRAAVYDAGKITEFMAQFTKSFAHFQYYFAYRQANPIIVPYEDFIANPTFFVNQFADCIGLPHPGPVSMGIANLKPQRNNLNNQYREKFIRDEGFSYTRDPPRGTL